jgi:hypothetical protein
MRSLGRPARRRRARGQALVEFALIIPIFLTLIVAIAEFAFLLTVKIGVTNTAQDAVQLGAELGNTPNADFFILQIVERDMGAPIDKTKIVSASIFKTNLYGANLGADTYVRSGTWTVNGITIPWSASGGAGYPTNSRCNVIATIVCGGVDWIGVTITYQYAWITPLPNLAGMGGAAPLFVQTSTSRLEPVQ